MRDELHREWARMRRGKWRRLQRITKRLNVPSFWGVSLASKYRRNMTAAARVRHD